MRVLQGVTGRSSQSMSQQNIHLFLPPHINSNVTSDKLRCGGAAAVVRPKHYLVRVKFSGSQN